MTGVCVECHQRRRIEFGRVVDHDDAPGIICAGSGCRPASPDLSALRPVEDIGGTFENRWPR